MPSPDPTPLYYVAGAPWDSAFAAATLAAVVGMLGLVWGMVGFALTRGRLSRFEAESLQLHHRALDADAVHRAREQWWARFESAQRMLLGKRGRQRDQGLMLMDELGKAEWVTDRDRALAADILERAADV